MEKPADGMSQALANALGVSRITADILTARGYSDVAAARRFLEPAFAAMPDPALLSGVAEALDRLDTARVSGESICVYGDYDVDGISATALMVSFLNRSGFNCGYFIPNRFDDGYGLSVDALEQIIRDGASLIISVDCGITAVEEALFCTAKGVDLIIVDLHTSVSKLPYQTSRIKWT